MVYSDSVSTMDESVHCSHCGASISSEQKYCPCCGELCDVNGWEECGKDRCGNCHSWLKDGDKYCRICGTKVGDGKYEPFQNIIQCIYGPMPVERTHKCRKCGYTWTTIQMIDREYYCPQCGGKAPYKQHEEKTDYVFIPSKRNKLQQEVAKIQLKVKIPNEISVAELAARVNKTVPEIIRRLMRIGTFASASDIIDYDTAASVAMELNCKVEKEGSTSDKD